MSWDVKLNKKNSCPALIINSVGYAKCRWSGGICTWDYTYEYKWCWTYQHMELVVYKKENLGEFISRIRRKP